VKAPFQGGPPLDGHAIRSLLPQGQGRSFDLHTVLYPALSSGGAQSARLSLAISIRFASKLSQRAHLVVSQAQTILPEHLYPPLIEASVRRGRARNEP